MDAIAVGIEAEDSRVERDFPGELGSLTEALGADLLALRLDRVSSHPDLEQGIGRFHEHSEEIYPVTHCPLRIRFGVRVQAASAAPASPASVRSHRNCGGEPVRMWAISQGRDEANATQVEDVWAGSPKTKQGR